MTFDHDIDRIANGWLEEFSSDRFPAERDEDGFVLQLDELVYRSPDFALKIIRRIAEKDISDWALEGVAVGPLRTLIAVYPDEYRQYIADLSRQSVRFRNIVQMALDGI